MDHPTVLVISDDVEFSRSITARWQMERHVPMFTLLSGDLWPRSIDNFAVAIVGPLRRELFRWFWNLCTRPSSPCFACVKTLLPRNWYASAGRAPRCCAVMKTG